MNLDRDRSVMIERHLRRRGISNEAVLRAMNNVHRHLFIGDNSPNVSYSDHPVHIGHGQTISQPYMVALMTEALQPSPGLKTLEIGTGSGYQTAILAHLGARVYTIERIPALSEFAQRNISQLELPSIEYKVSDGTLGWEEEAPFDRIIVTAGTPSVPQPYIDQLAEGGILVIPVGDRFFQTLQIIEKKGSETKTRSEGGCVFVKLIGEHGWQTDDY